MKYNPKLSPSSKDLVLLKFVNIKLEGPEIIDLCGWKYQQVFMSTARVIKRL